MVPVLFTFNLQGVLNLKKDNSAAKRLSNELDRKNKPDTAASNEASHFLVRTGCSVGTLDKKRKPVS